MKTNFFGISAKLALAIMAVSGALFTSCYDSVDGDVTPPYVAPKAVYSISGVVTNLATGMPVSGVTLTFTPTSGTAFTAAATNGTYNATTQVAGAYAVAIDATTAAKYSIKYGASFTINALPDGTSGSYMQNVVLEPKDMTGLKINFASEAAGVSSKTFDAATESKVDIVNDGNTFLNPYFTMKMDTGAKFVSSKAGGQDWPEVQPAATSKAVPAAVTTYVQNYLKAIYGGVLPVNQADAFKIGDQTYKFEVAPRSSVKTISATTRYKQDTYTFTYDGVDYVIVIIAVDAYEFANTQYSNDIYHGHGGHGHGHGHGGDLNAGGGIISGEI